MSVADTPDIEEEYTVSFMIHRSHNTKSQYQFWVMEWRYLPVACKYWNCKFFQLDISYPSYSLWSGILCWIIILDVWNQYLGLAKPDTFRFLTNNNLREPSATYYWKICAWSSGFRGSWTSIKNNLMASFSSISYYCGDSLSKHLFCLGVLMQVWSRWEKGRRNIGRKSLSSLNVSTHLDLIVYLRPPSHRW
jgi:hypothetical protein